MTISLQLIEIPDNEQVSSRQVNLPDSGGTIGRSFECTVQLPDFNRTLSRVHVELKKDPDSGQYIAIDRSRNGTYLNNTLLGHGRRQVIKDGDHLRIGAYSLLISTLDSLFAEPAAPSMEPADEPELNAQFSLTNVQQEEQGFEPLSPVEPNARSAKTSNIASGDFSSGNALVDDAFGYDPFDDDELDVAAGHSLDADGASVIEHNRGQDANSGLQQQFDQNLRQLNQLVEQQKQLTAQAGPTQAQILDTLQVTLESFLDSLNPEHLEDEFSDFVSGWGSKDKKYWALYRKQFQRKLRKKEYHRQFMALFMEELRKQS